MDANAPPGPRCPTCQGALRPTTQRRHGGCLVVLGYPLFALGGLAVVLALLTLVGFLKNTAPTVQTYVSARQAEVVRRLEAIRGLPPSVIEEFRSTGRVSEDTLRRLPIRQRLGVGANLLGHGLVLGRASEQGRAMFAVVVLVPVIVMLFGALAFALGWIMTSRKRVLACDACGVALERLSG